jgi:hypothetical protein
MFEIVRVYHDPYVWSVPCGRSEEKTAEFLAWRDRLRRTHRDVHAGKCNVGIRWVES